VSQNAAHCRFRLSDMTKQAKFLVAVLLIANALFARLGSRAFGRTSGWARIMTFLSLVVSREVHLGSRACAGS
jgi:hypothetical protein